MACVVMLLLFVTVFTTTASAADRTWDDDYKKTGYHLEKHGEAEPCKHDVDKAAYVVSKCTGLNPTKTDLKNSVVTSTKSLKIKNIKVVSANGTPGTGGSVSPYALQVTVENVKFRDWTFTIASPYADATGGMTGYNYIYMKFSWCKKTETWYFVGAEHYWLGTVDGRVGVNEVHNTAYIHNPQRYKIVPNEYAIKFDGNSATEMCAYLLNYCEIEVIDAQTKARKITWNQHVILNGTINPTDYFIIEFEKDEVQDIRWGVSHVKWWNDGVVMAHAGFPNGLGTSAAKIEKQIANDSSYRHKDIETCCQHL